MNTPDNSAQTPSHFETPLSRAQVGLGVIALEGIVTSAALLVEAANGVSNIGLGATLLGGFATMVATGIAFTRPANRKQG